MDALEGSEREAKEARVQPHVSPMFKFLLALLCPENEIHTVHHDLQSPGTPLYPLPLSVHALEVTALISVPYTHQALPHLSTCPSLCLEKPPCCLPQTDSSEAYSFFERRGHFHSQKRSCCLGHHCTPGTWHTYAVIIQWCLNKQTSFTV